MYLKRLSLINFKNIGQEEFPLTPGINCFVGDNGAGKTNFIDAIHYLSMCKSAFSMTDTQSVRHGEEFSCSKGVTNGRTDAANRSSARSPVGAARRSNATARSTTACRIM